MEINILQVIFQIINFGVVFGALTYFLTKPIIKMLDDRRAQTEEAAKAAENTLRERESLESMKKKAKVQSEKDAQALIDGAKAEAKELKNKLTKEIKEEVNALRAKEIAKLESEMQARKEESEKEIVKLSVAIASKVIEKEIDEKTHKSLVAKAIKDLGHSL